VRKNWAGNLQFQAATLHQPKTAEQVRALILGHAKLKAMGSRHCFNDIADSPDHQISTESLDKLVSLDEQTPSVTVAAGMRYGQCAQSLHRAGYALQNLASLLDISVAGAVATATHGSGSSNGNLATAVRGLEFVSGAGDTVNLQRGGDPEFEGVLVGLGAVGVITKVVLDVQPTYSMCQHVFQNLPLATLRNHFDDIMSCGYSVSLFTDWKDDVVSQVWVKRRIEAGLAELGEDLYGATAATRNLHPIAELSSANCTDQLGDAGPWYERLPHFKIGFTPSRGEELQSEYFIPRHHAVDAIAALEKKRDLISPELFISEIRTVAADGLWLSPCYQRDCVAIHFTWKQNWPRVQKLLVLIEAELSPYDVRPHWGKLFTMPPRVLRSRYERLPEFLKLVERYDPRGKFRNAYLDRNFYL
jgi:xylitol oxidase